jgi:zinc protease
MLHTLMHNKVAHAAVLSVLALVAGTSSPAHAMKIQSVKSPGGIEAWLVEEHSLPLVAMQFGFMGGASQDPPDKPGVAHFLTAMFDEGAGDLTAAQFQERQEELAMKMGYDAGRDSMVGSFTTLTDNLDAAAELLRLALTKPRFDMDAVERMRKQLGASLAFDLQDPDRVADNAWFGLAFSGHPYSRPVQGTLESIAAIGPADLEAYRSRVFARDNLKVAVVGDIDATRLAALLDHVFGGLPEKADLTPVPAVEPPADGLLSVIQMDVPQSVAQFGHGALARKDPDFIPAYVVNYIIGGGGFSSRLMEEVREKRGLAYSVYSYMQPFQRSAVYIGGVATKNDAMAKSLEVIRSELARMAAEGPTPEELENAKSYLIGSYALRFDSNQRIASMLLGIMIEDLGIDYVDRRNSLVEAVTIEDVKRAAKRLLRPESLIVTVVGKPTNL